MLANEWLKNFIYNFICIEEEISDYLDLFNSNNTIDYIFSNQYYLNGHTEKQIKMFLDDYKFETVDENGQKLIVFDGVKLSCRPEKIRLQSSRSVYEYKILYRYEIVDHNFDDIPWFKEKPMYVLEFEFSDNENDVEYVECRILHKKLADVPTYVYEELK
jgi:hypothetical protein